MSRKREIEHKISELKGLLRTAENEREHYSREVDKYKDNMQRFSMLARQKDGLEKEEFESKYSHAHIDYVDAMKRYSEWRDEATSLQADIAELEKERDGIGPGGGPGGGPTGPQGGGPATMAIAAMTPEKQKELAEDNTPRLGRQSPDLGDDFDEI